MEQGGGETKQYPEEARYEKLVRDGIPRIIESRGLKIETRTLTPEETVIELKKKVVEEAQEVAESETVEDTELEISDNLEILMSLAEELGLDWARIEELRQKRAKERGRFKNRTYLVRTFKG